MASTRPHTVPPGPAPRRVLRTVLVAEILSMTGSQLSAIAMPWFVLETTGSSGAMGRVMAAQMIAVAVFGVMGASLAGRLGPRRVMLVADCTRGPLVALVPLLHHFGLLPLPVFMLLLFAVGSFYAPYTASQQSLLPALVGDDEARLSRANAMLQGATRFTVLLGPPVAGLLIAWLGASAVLSLDAASYLVSAFLLRRGLPPGVALPVRAARHRLRDALRTVRRDRLLGNWTIAQVLGETTWQALFAMLPVLALLHYGGSSALAGLLLGAFGGGALLGTLLVGRALRRLSATRLATCGRLGQTAAFAVLPLPLGPAGLAAVLAVAGLLNGLSNAPMVAVRTSRIPVALRPATLTVIAAAGLTGGTLGLVGAGTAAETLPVSTVFTVLAALQVLAGAFFVVGAVRGRDAPAPAAAPAPGASPP
ncbi:MFS transporter [Streptomyces sp. ISL-11]|uniref:MFS transporter n=1 Tax=Streptomyces sp. ISL-11 TaxID=2819174 RepID=UPI001BE96BB8|nr:MFS transporter [Streptomyces sp. ISL-11]MBT2382945.1 MFS transporter [Streptomyces sp. ISL-11]